jgi:hypothetical protein
MVLSISLIIIYRKCYIKFQVGMYFVQLLFFIQVNRELLLICGWAESPLQQFIYACVAEYVKPICLPFDDTEKSRYLGEELVVTGWGRTESSECNVTCTTLYAVSKLWTWISYNSCLQVDATLSLISIIYKSLYCSTNYSKSSITVALKRIPKMFSSIHFDTGWRLSRDSSWSQLLSELELLHDWRFTANTLAFALSTLRIKPSHITWGPCPHSMARPRVADGGTASRYGG